jgi:hypothetical protein
MLGRFQTAKLAAQAHDRTAVLVFGKNAVTNLGFDAAKEDLCNRGCWLRLREEEGLF